MIKSKIYECDWKWIKMIKSNKKKNITQDWNYLKEIKLK